METNPTDDLDLSESGAEPLDVEDPDLLLDLEDDDGYADDDDDF
jgi:hypothetical protein